MAQDNGGPLPLRKGCQCLHQFAASLDVGEMFIGALPLRSLGEQPFDMAAPVMAPAEVHDRLTQIGAEGVTVTDVREPAAQPDERVLHDIFRNTPVPGKEIREAKRSIRMLLEELIEIAAGADPGFSLDLTWYRQSSDHIPIDATPPG